MDVHNNCMVCEVRSMHLGLWQHQPRQERRLEQVVEEAQAAQTTAQGSSAQVCTSHVRGADGRLEFFVRDASSPAPCRTDNGKGASTCTLLTTVESVRRRGLAVHTQTAG